MLLFGPLVNINTPEAGPGEEIWWPVHKKARGSCRPGTWLWRELETPIR